MRNYPKHYCGVFGIYGHPNAAELTYYGLYALQHRGQESAGIVSSNGRRIWHHKGMGQVADVFDEDTLRDLRGWLAIGHTRYSTSGSANWTAAQPVFRAAGASGFALGHNGNLTNSDALRRRVEGLGHELRATTDSELITALLAHEGGSLLDAVCNVMPLLQGAYSIVTLTEHELVAFRDPNGVLLEIRVSEKSSPNEKSPVTPFGGAACVQNAPNRSKAPRVYPRRLAHILIFTT